MIGNSRIGPIGTLRETRVYGWFRRVRQFPCLCVATSWASVIVNSVKVRSGSAGNVTPISVTMARSERSVVMFQSGSPSALRFVVVVALA